MEATSAVKREYGGKGSWVKYWARLSCWISQCYGPFSLGALFETYKPFISLIFNFFFGPRSTADNWNRGYWTSEYGGTPVSTTRRVVTSQKTSTVKHKARSQHYRFWDVSFPYSWFLCVSHNINVCLQLHRNECNLSWAEFSRLTHACRTIRCPFVQQPVYLPSTA
jgi:hypothetical protein